MEIPDKDIELFLESIQSRSNYDFSDYSLNSLKRRVRKLMNDHHVDINGLVEKIRADWNFTEKVVKSITVTTTEFFRDPAVWISLKENILPSCRKQEGLSVWINGCSTGQEIYSLMILLQEAGLLDKARICASDINTDVLETSGKGIYKYRFNKDFLKNFDLVINAEKKEKNRVPYTKYFNVDEQSDTITMKKTLTNKPVYRKMDLVRDENPFGIQFDLIICRNVIIYFNYDLQNRVLSLFHQNLKRDGWLLLGIHESIIGPYSSYFDKRFQLYKKK